ncbi:MAG: phosphoglucosamine mutase [Acidobacteriota bacterium]|nr:phosphoglucosamine mutase [Acidobacteriota bacterium]
MKLFGTDGLRGRAGKFPLDALSVRRIGCELGRRLAGGQRRKAVIGGDTRESTQAITAGLAAGIVEGGGEVAAAGVLTTPGVAEVVLELSAGAGISVSASHNPWEDNGIKIFGADGRKWPDADEDALEKTLLHPDGRVQETFVPEAPEADPSLARLYLDRLARSVPVRLDGLMVLVDAGNGAAYRLGPDALRRAGADVSTICDAPDGRNINEKCGALHPDGMAAAVRDRGMSLGVAYDGDADRSIFSDENGRILDGDDVLWVIAKDWKRKGILAAGGVVGTVMSNFGLEAALAREGIPFRRSAVGDRNVARLMEETGAPIGGETSGHVLLPFSPAGDGILTTLLLASIVVESGKPISQLANLEKTPQALRNVRVARRLPLEEAETVQREWKRALARLERRGRVFLRYSGTEPLLRVLVEGPDAAEVREIADALESAVRADFDRLGEAAS